MSQPRRFIDLHTHSTASDGQLAPEQLIACADRAGLAMMALTDHDTLEGLAPARAAAEQYPELRFVGGLEISARYQPGTMHILGLGVRDDCRELLDLCQTYRDARNDRNPRILDKLRKLGLPIDMDDVLAAARRRGDSGVVSRVHIAQAMQTRGHVGSVKEAFDRYIGQGQPAYVDKEIIAPAEAIAAIHAADGVAVLAHPIQLHYENRAQLETILKGLRSQGLDGVEAYHSDHPPATVRLLLDLARRLELGVTGGSDYHGAGKPHVNLGQPRVPLAAIDDAFLLRMLGD